MMLVFSSTVIVSTLLAVCLGQDFDVFVEPVMPGYVDQGTSSEITCRYPVVDSSYSFRYLVWRKGDPNGAVDTADIVASYATGGTPSYPVTSKNYSMTTDTISSSSTLTVESLEFDDEGRYWCSVQFRLSGNPHLNGVNFTLLNVLVPPTMSMLSDSSGVEHPSFGGKVSLMVGETLIFTCKVPDINPGAVFTWMVGTDPLAEDSSSNNPEVGLGNLTTSISVATLTAEKNQDKKSLKCSASNKEGDPGLSISVELSITDPCQDNPCENGGTCTNWNGMPNCTCTEQFTGVNCTEIAATTPGIPETSTKIGVTSTKPSGVGTTTESSTGSITSETSSFSTTEEKSPEPTTTDQPPDRSNTTNSATTTDGVLASSTAEELTTSDPGIDDPGAPDGLSGGAIAGIVIGAVAAVAFVIGIGVFIHSKHPGTAVKPDPLNGGHNEPNREDVVLRVKKKEDG